MQKNEILKILAGREYVSGEFIAEKLGISRNSVWKAVNSLREEGYVIESKTNRGYILLDSPDILTAEDIKAHLGDVWDLYSFELFDNVDSTNRVALDEAAKGAAAGTVIIAETQSAGRGRLGRSFYSPPGNGIYMTLIIRPNLSSADLPLVTACVGTAVSKAVDRVYGVETGIKWVNDIFLDGKKLCGILSQSNIDMESGRAEAVAVGIGVNVGKKSFPEELREVAVSLEEHTGKKIPRAVLIAEILKNLVGTEEQIESRSFIDEYRRRSTVVGNDIIVHTPLKSYPAKAVGIDGNAALVVKTEDGQVQTLDSGEVSVRIKQNEV